MKCKCGNKMKSFTTLNDAAAGREQQWCKVCGRLMFSGAVEEPYFHEPTIIVKVQELIGAMEYILGNGAFHDGLDCIGKLAELKTMIGGKG